MDFSGGHAYSLKTGTVSISVPFIRGLYFQVREIALEVGLKCLDSVVSANWLWLDALSLLFSIESEFWDSPFI